MTKKVTEKPNQGIEPAAPALEFILLSDITPSLLNPRKTIDEHYIAELAESIKKLGLIQPITVRPLAPAKENPHQAKYELVCGECRYLAADLAGLKALPASVRDLSDQEAMEVMITENLQRKDVHPMEEADAFRFMVDKMNYELADIGAKIGKNEPFVVRRLQLTKLIDELKKIFRTGELHIGHAELLSRINDQHQLLWFKDKYSATWNGGVGTVSSLREWLKSQTEKLLKDAPFKTDFSYEGKEFISPSCTTCAKNSAFNNSLFPDTADQATCHDSLCYRAKCNADFNERLQQAIDDTDVVLIDDSYGDERFRKKLIAEGHVVLFGWDSYSAITKPNKNDWQYKEHPEKYEEAIKGWRTETKTAIKGFKINGANRGEYFPIKLKTSKETSAQVANDPKMARKQFIADLNQKRTRGREIDAEKVMKKQVDAIKELSFIKSPDEVLVALTPVESNALLCLAWQKCGNNAREYVRKALDMKNGYGDSYEDFEKLLSASEPVKAYIIRNAVYHNFISITPTDLNGAVINALTKDWMYAEFEQINSDQQGIRERREAKLDQKIKEFDKNLLTEMA